MTNNVQYTQLAKILHWLIAGLILAQYLLAELAENAHDGGYVVKQIGLLANHKSVGITILVLAFIRLFWRLFNKPPALPESISPRQQALSHAAHWLIYSLIFLLPITGWLMSSASAYTVSWFHIIVLPDLVSANPTLTDFLHCVHSILSNILLVIVLIHVSAALKHHFIDKDGVLQRMSLRLAWGWLLIPCLFVLFFYVKQAEAPQKKVNEEPYQVSSVTSGGNDTPIGKLSRLPVWGIDYSKSYIRFTGDQAGAPFEGFWNSWQASMQFDSTNLGESLFDVSIDTSLVSTSDSERDSYITGADFFDSENYTQARFIADNMTQLQGLGYVSQGRLSIKGLTKSLPFNFTVERSGRQVVLNGSATIDRLAWNIGQGEWRDTTWVGADVEVAVYVIATIE